MVAATDAADASAQATGGDRAPGTLALRDCTFPNQLAARCGTYTVWENREARSGRTIDLKLVVIPARTESDAEPIFFLAGGPGQAAAYFAPAVSLLLPDRLREHHDIVLVDQRGTGESNGLQCPVQGIQDVVSSLSFRLVPGGVSACRDALDADLRLYTTPIAMDDLDDVRRALGHDGIHLWGGSYGTRAALVYMRRHGAHVRSAVLRGIAPTYAKLPLYMARDAQLGIGVLQDECDTDDACRAAYPDFGSALARVVARLDESPATAEADDPLGGGRVTVTIDGDGFSGGVRLLQYATQGSRSIPAIVESASRGNFDPFLKASLPFGAQIIQQISIGMFLSVVCAEDVPWLTPEETERATRDTYAGDRMVRNIIDACRDWPLGELPAGYWDPVVSDIPTLLISGEEDPVTPPSWGAEVARHLSNSLHVVVPRAGHVPSTPGCVAELAVQFIESASPYGLDASCVQRMPRPPFTIPGG